MRVVHSTDKRLCSAPHIGLDEKTFVVHPRSQKIPRASDYWDELREYEERPTTKVKDLRPSKQGVSPSACTLFLYGFVADH